MRPELTNPDAFVCHPSYCVVGAADEGIEGSVVMVGSMPRATAQWRFAQELSTEFSNVRCRTIYMHVYTRQESWENKGRDRRLDSMPSEMDEDVWAPERVPDGWEPDEYDAAWRYTDINDSAAIKAWEFESL